MQLGENIKLGVGKESTRGTAVAPAMWIAGRVPTSIKTVLEKALIKESKGSRAMSQDSVITSQRVEGELEFNVRNASIGYLLLSLLGSVNSVESADSGIYDHTFTVDVDEPQAPTLTTAISRGGGQDYQIPRTVISSIQLSMVQGDVVYATAGFLGEVENEVSDYSPAFATDDHLFTRQNVSVKFANDVAGLSGASAKCLTEINLNISNSARPKVCLGSLTPQDIIALLIDVNGSFKMDYVDKAFYDLYKAGTPQAMEITITNDAVDIGASSNPEIKITLPKVSFEGYDEDRPIDDITNEGIDFVAHYDNDEAEQIEVVVKNEETSY